jgi:hypothetical protein
VKSETLDLELQSLYFGSRRRLGRLGRFSTLGSLSATWTITRFKFGPNVLQLFTMAAPSPTHPSLVVPPVLSIVETRLMMQKTRGHHAPYTGTEESRYRTKCKDLKRKITDVEAENDMLTVKIDRSKRSITRMRLERALLLEKLEEKTPAHVDDSDGSDTDVSSVRPHLDQTNSIGRTGQTESCTTLRSTKTQ